MRLWRVSNYRTLDGRGGMVVGGRWHSMGKPVVYAAESAALALLEAIVQFESRAELPPDYQLMQLDSAADLHFNEWTGKLPAREESVAWGDGWLARGDSTLARVPAAVAPDSFNWLINPAHEAARTIRVARATRHPWDPRLRR